MSACLLAHEKVEELSFCLDVNGTLQGQFQWWMARNEDGDADRRWGFLEGKDLPLSILDGGQGYK